MRKDRDKDLTREVLEQLIGETGGDGMPVILARRIDPQIPTTNTLTDYGFEGLKMAEKGGKMQWEPTKNFVLYIEGNTGNCRIPRTDNNLARLKRLSIGGKETVKRLIMGDDGKIQTIEEEVEIPPTYKMMEQNLATSTLVNTIAQKVMALMSGAIQQESDAPIPESVRKQMGRPKKSVLADPLPNIMEPLR